MSSPGRDREGIIMKEKKVKLAGNKEVTEFVQAAENCGFDIDVCYDRILVDGKSILGMLGLDLTKALTVRYSGENEAFEKIVEKYEVK